MIDISESLSPRIDPGRGRRIKPESNESGRWFWRIYGCVFAYFLFVLIRGLVG